MEIHTRAEDGSVTSRRQPVLVNCHTHLEGGWMAELCPPPSGRPFANWMGELIERNRRLRASGQAERTIRSGIEAGIQSLLAAGTTHVGDISLTGISIEPLFASGLAGVVYLEVLGLDNNSWQSALATAQQLLDKYRRREGNGLRLGLSPHAPYSTHPDAFAAVTAYCLSEDVPMCIHAAESPAESQALLSGSGPMVELYRRLKLAPPPSPGLSPVTYLASLGVLAAKPLLVHMVQVSDEELELVAKCGAKVAHCPRSNQRLQCGRMPLEKMLARGIPMALGSDGLNSSPSLDVREEAQAAALLHQGYVAADVITPLLGQSHVLS